MKRTVLLIAIMTNVVSVGQQEQPENQELILKRLAAAMAADVLEKQRKGETEEEIAANEKRLREWMIAKEQQEQENKRNELLANEKQVLTQERLAKIKALAAVKEQGQRAEIVRLLIETAATATGKAYVETRDEILVYGKDYHALLAEIAVDETLPWQQRLVARICYERIERKKDIEQLLETDWYSHPDFNPEWRLLLPGPIGPMTKLVHTDVQKAGLWYYCLEQVWKSTGEMGEIYKGRHQEGWVGCCALAVKDNPEERVWFLRVCAEILAMSPPPPRWNNWLYPTLCREEKPDVAPLLLEVMRDYKGDIFSFVVGLSKFADSRVADTLDKFVAARPDSPDVEYLGPPLAAVRTRAAPPPSPEPPFRLGTKIIKPAKQP